MLFTALYVLKYCYKHLYLTIPYYTILACNYVYQPHNQLTENTPCLYYHMFNYTITCSVHNRLSGLSRSPQRTQQHCYPWQQSVTHSHHRCQLSVAQLLSHRTTFISQVTSHNHPKMKSSVLVICVLVLTVFCIVCTVFCIVCTVFWYCFVYAYLPLFVTSVRTTATE